MFSHKNKIIGAIGIGLLSFFFLSQALAANGSPKLAVAPWFCKSEKDILELMKMDQLEGFEAAARLWKLKISRSECIERRMVFNQYTAEYDPKKCKETIRMQSNTDGTTMKRIMLCPLKLAKGMWVVTRKSWADDFFK